VWPARQLQQNCRPVEPADEPGADGTVWRVYPAGKK